MLYNQNTFGLCSISNDVRNTASFPLVKHVYLYPIDATWYANYTY